VRSYGLPTICYGWCSVAEQRVTDEQLAEWAEWGDELRRTGANGIANVTDFLALVAELRASRAREADLAAGLRNMERRRDEARAERNELQRRLTKLLDVLRPAGRALDFAAQARYERAARGRPVAPWGSLEPEVRQMWRDFVDVALKPFLQALEQGDYL
jgi:septal ring factor EnvC (AmiA/AmiB activator)